MLISKPVPMNQPPPEASSLTRITFTAGEVEFGEYEYGVEVFSAVGGATDDAPVPHVVIMRSHSDLPVGLHLDCDYPLYGGVYDAVAHARISPGGLQLNLRTDMAVQLRELGGYDVRWNLPAGEYEKIVRGLQSLFRGTDVLEMAGG